MSAENHNKEECKCEVVKKVTIKLNQAEYDALVRFARRDRRVPSAQAAEMLSEALLVEVEEERFEEMSDPTAGVPGEINPAGFEGLEMVRQAGEQKEEMAEQEL